MEAAITGAARVIPSSRRRGSPWAIASRSVWKEQVPSGYRGYCEGLVPGRPTQGRTDVALSYCPRRPRTPWRGRRSTCNWTRQRLDVSRRRHVCHYPASFWYCCRFTTSITPGNWKTNPERTAIFITITRRIGNVVHTASANASYLLYN